LAHLPRQPILFGLRDGAIEMALAAAQGEAAVPGKKALRTSAAPPQWPEWQCVRVTASTRPGPRSSCRLEDSLGVRAPSGVDQNDPRRSSQRVHMTIDGT